MPSRTSLESRTAIHAQSRSTCGRARSRARPRMQLCKARRSPRCRAAGGRCPLPFCGQPPVERSSCRQTRKAAWPAWPSALAMERIVLGRGQGDLSRAGDRDRLELLGAHHRAEPSLATGRRAVRLDGGDAAQPLARRTDGQRVACPCRSCAASASSVSRASMPHRSSAGRMLTSSSRMRMRTGVSAAPVMTMPS